MQKAYNIPEHLIPACNNDGYCNSCGEPVKQSADGRWYITMGHPGFNSSTNNGQGYATKAAAVAAHRKYAGK